MANLTAKKSDAISALVAFSIKAEGLARDIAELQSFFTDNGFLTGGGNAIVDGDCVGANAHLTATLVNSGVTAIATMALSTPNKTVLRQIAATSVLPSS